MPSLNSVNNVTYEIVLIGIVVAVLGYEDRIFNNSASAGKCNLDKGSVGNVAAECDVRVTDACGKAALLALKANVLYAAGGIPHTEAMLEHGSCAALESEAGCHLVAIAVAIPVVAPALIVERDALGLIDSSTVDKERMDVTERVARALHKNTCLNRRDTHIAHGVVVALDKNADRALLVVTYDIYGLDISVGRAVVCAALDVDTDKCVLDGYVAALRSISEKYDLPFDLSAVSAARLPDVLSVEKQETDQEELASELDKLLDSAIDSFNEMRKREGAKLESDVRDRLVTLENLVSSVEEPPPSTVPEYRARLYAKLQDVLGQTSIDESRILTEAAIFADKVAVDEETVRLRSHIAQMREMLTNGSPVGRKLDFLIQEFNREANTIGSKCSDKAIAAIVIELKSEIEKIREQIQNIE